MGNAPRVVWGVTYVNGTPASDPCSPVKSTPFAVKWMLALEGRALPGGTGGITKRNSIPFAEMDKGVSGAMGAPATLMRPCMLSPKKEALMLVAEPKLTVVPPSAGPLDG